MKMKQVYISYNGCCCVPGPVNKLAILGSDFCLMSYSSHLILLLVLKMFTFFSCRFVSLLIIILQQKKALHYYRKNQRVLLAQALMVQETWCLCTFWIPSCAMRISCFTFNISWCWRCWLRGISKYHIFFLEKQSKLSNLIFETAKIMAFQKTKLLFCILTIVGS